MCWRYNIDVFNSGRRKIIKYFNGICSCSCWYRINKENADAFGQWCNVFLELSGHGELSVFSLFSCLFAFTVVDQLFPTLYW